MNSKGEFDFVHTMMACCGTKGITSALVGGVWYCYLESSQPVYNMNVKAIERSGKTWN